MWDDRAGRLRPCVSSSLAVTHGVGPVLSRHKGVTKIDSPTISALLPMAGRPHSISSRPSRLAHVMSHSPAHSLPCYTAGSRQHSMLAMLAVGHTRVTVTTTPPTPPRHHAVIAAAAHATNAPLQPCHRLRFPCFPCFLRLREKCQQGSIDCCLQQYPAHGVAINCVPPVALPARTVRAGAR